MYSKSASRQRETLGVSPRQFRRLKKGIAARPRRRDAGQPPVMHHNRIPVPEIDGWQIASQNLLRLNIFGAPPGGVLTLRCIAEQGVEPRVRVVAAVHTFGREAGC